MAISLQRPTLQQVVNIVAAAVVSAAVVFGGFKMVHSYLDDQEAIRSLTEQVATQSTEIGSLRESLSLTEEGKRQVEAAKAKADTNAATQASRARNAEADATSAHTQLDAANAQLSSVNVQLSAANTQLAAVNRCISVFNNIRPTIGNYQQAQVDENDYNNKAVAAYNADNYPQYKHYIDLANGQTQIANALWPRINSALTSVASGVCY